MLPSATFETEVNPKFLLAIFMAAYCPYLVPTLLLYLCLGLAKKKEFLKYIKGKLEVTKNHNNFT